MALPKHTCISCTHLLDSGTTIIPKRYREEALDDKKWNNGHINYERIICNMGKQDFSDFNQNNRVIDIRDEAIKPNKCKDWTRFIGISPIAIEQRKSSRWAKYAFLVALLSLIAILVTWILSQFVLNCLD
jgi:hypothetical protein